MEREQEEGGKENRSQPPPLSQMDSLRHHSRWGRRRPPPPSVEESRLETEGGVVSASGRTERGLGGYWMDLLEKAGSLTN